MRNRLCVIFLTLLATGYSSCKDTNKPAASATDFSNASPMAHANASAMPSGTIVLFDGKDTSAWQHKDGKPCQWVISDGAIESRESDIETKQKFNDFFLHVEFAPPVMPEATGQAKGNSGVYLQGRYEIQ